MFKKTKILSIILCIVLLATMVVGCSESSDQVEKDTDATPSQQEEDKDVEDKDVEDDGDDEKPKLRHLGYYNRFDPNEDPTAKFLYEQTGYEVEYDMLPAENAEDKLNLLMSNQEDYDILKLTVAQYHKLASEGALQELDGLIDEYGDNIKSVVSQESFDAIRIDGKIYGIPEKIALGTVGTCIGVRTDILEELNLEIPETLDEFYSMLKTIKEEKDIIPLTGNGGIVESIISAFGLPSSMQDHDGQLVARVQDPAMKEYLAFMQKLYKEGLIDSEWPINDGSKTIEKFTSGKAAAMRYAWWQGPSVGPALRKNFPDSDIAIIGPLKASDGTQAIEKTAGISWVIGVPAFSKNKEHAIKYMNMKLEDDIFKGLAIGQEGVHYTEEDGDYYPIDPTFFDERGFADWFLTGIDEEKYPVYWQARVRKDEDLQKAFEEIQELSADCMVESLTAYAPPFKHASEYTQKLNQMEQDKYIAIIAGKDPVESLDEFVEKWLNEGGQQVMDEVNEWYSQQ